MALTPISYETSLGPVFFWAHWERMDARKPLALVIRGAFAELTLYDGLPKTLSEFDVLLAHLPGMHTPTLHETSIESFARGFDEALRKIGRRAHVFGFSVGGLVALAMQETHSTVAVDPPLQTAPLWPLIPKLKSLPGAQQQAWAKAIFGVGETVENRDYRHLVRPDATVVIASEPLEPPRSLPRMPGLITAEDRAWLRTRCRAVTLPNTSHSVVANPEAAKALIDLFRTTCASELGTSA